MPRVVHLLPQHDTTESVAQAKLVSRALTSDGHESCCVRLGYDLPWQGTWNLSCWNKLFARLRQLRPDVIHAWLAADDWPTLAGLTQRGSWPVVVHWRELEPWPVGFLPRWTAGGARTIVVPTTGLQEAFQKRGMDEKKLIVIPDAVEPLEVTSHDWSKLRVRHGMSEDATIVVAVGRWRWSDHWKSLIWTADLLKFMGNDTHLVMCGYGHDTGRVEKYRSQIEIADRVHLRPIDEMPQWLTLADAFWSGRDDPGVSPWLLQAMAQGVPVIATQTADHVRLVTHEQNGLLFPIGDRAALARQTTRIMEDSALEARLREQGKDHVRQTHGFYAVAAGYRDSGAWDFPT